MSTQTSSLTAVGAGNGVSLLPGQSALYNASGATITATVLLEYTENGNTWVTVTSAAPAAGTLALSGIITNESNVARRYRLRVSAYTTGTISLVVQDVGSTLAIQPAAAVGGMAGIGYVNQPSSGVVGCFIQKNGPFALLTFTLNAVQIAVTDAGASGASGSHKLFDFDQVGIVPLGCRQDYTAFTEGAALTGAAGDAAFVMGLGSAAANAGDGVLTSTEVDFGAVTGTITLSGGTGTGTKLSGAGLNSSAALDGTGTAIDLYLNWCGTAATIDATSTIDVTGTVSVLVALLGDD